MGARQRRLKKIFVSHSAKDRKFVVKLTKLLSREKIAYWYSVHHIAGADQWHDEIGTALKACNWFLIVLSPNSAKSKWVKLELLYALKSNRYNGRIIPVLLKSCNHARISWTLSSFQFVHFSGSFDRGCRQLLKAINKRR